MPARDTLDKVIPTYFACMTIEVFEFRGKQYKPRALSISPLIFRSLGCPAKCGACCPRFSLDYLPSEWHEGLDERVVQFNGREFKLFSDMQNTHENHHCQHLDMNNGRCKIHGEHPFSCDFEILRFFQFADESKPHRLSTQHYGRAWQMLRVDGERGTLCTIDANDVEAARSEVVRKLKRLKEWTDYFELKTKLEQIISWASNVSVSCEAVIFN